MSKKTIEKIIKILPETLKNINGYMKDNFDKSGQEALSNVTGTVGILVKLFAQDKLDNYFENISKDKLKDFASNIYLKASLIQVNKSLDYINEENDLNNDPKSIVALLSEILTIQNNQFNKDDILTIFTPKYHPIIVFTKDKFTSVLNELNISNSIIKKFIANFNENIEITVKECFGDEDYTKHQEEIKDFILKDNETNLLWDTYQLQKIGFKEDENLEYEETYARWKPISNISNLSDGEERDNYDDFIKKEDDLVLAETLVDDYFNTTCKKSNCLNNILFAVADFGKGKTIFLQQYAVKLAKEYLETKEGYFPIYFNLRDYGSYSNDGTLGILGDYLLNKYSIRIDDEHFKTKKYLFLVDSLDESGDLTKSATERVIQSIKNIQNIDKEFRKNNRIVITSRPFPDGLEFHLKSHNPLELENSEKKYIPQFLSIYGFKANQFNHWLYSSLKSYGNLKEIKTSGFAKEIINNILKNKEQIDIYKKLIDENTLSKTELRRPIFAYMIFQLILNNVDFLEIGKIGVYLSFINLLTRKAKHVNDPSHEVNLTEEIQYRNILHSISSLWMYERQHSQQGILKKADICRVIEPKYSDETDKVILEKFKEDGITEIQFMSHSYFGENDDILHFQHQSFAEILLAEYYLKIFIKFALDENSDTDDARAKLILGEPTEQTIVFFKELIKLLKETVSSNNKTVIEKRKLLYPLMASLSLKEHNTLYSNDLYYDWFRNIKIDKDSITYPEELLTNWAITEEKLEKIINFATKIIDDKTTILMAKTKQKNALFNNELTVFQNKFICEFPTDLDKWLALTLGNILDTNIDEEKFFNSRINNTINLFQMIKNWNYSNNTSAPEWVKKYFIGIMMKDTDELNLRNLDLSELNFSYSNLININMSRTNLSDTCFNNCIFENIELNSSILHGACFDNIEINGDRLGIGLSQISHNILIPIKMADIFLGFNSKELGMYVNNGLDISYISFTKQASLGKVDNIFNTLKGLLSFGLKKELFKLHDIKTWFKYEDTEVQNEFESLIDTLK